MPSLSRNLNGRVARATIAYIAVTAALLSSILYTQLHLLADSQQTALGEALAVQLAETLKQPLIDEDVISMQVVLDNLTQETQAVGRSTIYSSANQILAQSQRPGNATNLIPFIQPISLDNTILGQIRVELDAAALQAVYRMPLWSTLGAWLATSMVFGLWLMVVSRGYTKRLLRVASFFSYGDTPEDISHSELETLEKGLEPFASGLGDRLAAQNPDFSLLAISVPNLPRWRAQLNAEHFNHILQQLDGALERCIALYHGIRLHTRNTTVFVQFPNNGEERPLMRALSCGAALMYLGQQLTATERLPFEMRMATGYCAETTVGSPWRTDLDREQVIDKLIGILPLANAWELLIDREDIEPQQLVDCVVDELKVEEIWEFKGFTEERETVFERQLEYISQPAATPH